MRLIVLSISLALFVQAKSQSIQSEVISSFGEQSIAASIILSSTCGESIAESAISQNFNFHSGFQQGYGDVLTNYYSPGSLSNGTWQIYPNPTGGTFNIHRLSNVDYQTNLKFRIYDVSGRVIQTGCVSSDITTVFMETASTGLYILHLYPETKQPITLPFVVAHN